METIAAHRERVVQLRETLERLIGQHRRLYELRSESWHEQQEGDPDRAETLDALHRQIDEAEDEAERLSALLSEGLDAMAPESPALAEEGPALAPESPALAEEGPAAAEQDPDVPEEGPAIAEENAAEAPG